MNSIHHSSRARSFVLALLLSAYLGGVPQLAHAINKCTPQTTVINETQNIGLQVNGSYNACMAYAGDPLQCATLSFSTPGPFSIEHWFVFPTTCNSLAEYNVIYTGIYGVQGYVRPKYLVVGLHYAPPGATGTGGDSSSVTYANGFMSGTSQNVSQAFGESTNVSASLSYGTSAGKSTGETAEGGTISAGISGTWSETQNNGSSITIALNETQGSTLDASTVLGVDHDYDVIAIWLDPMISTAVTGSNELVDLGDVDDPRDPITADGSPDVVYLSVGQLEGSVPIPAGTQALLQRPWDPQLGALDSADYADILNSDPFVNNPGFDPATDPSGRYSNMDTLIYYEGTGTTTCNNYSSSYSSTSGQSTGGTDSHSVTYSLDGSGSYDLFTAKLNLSTTYSYQNSWSSSITQGSSQSASFNICSPPLTYSGPPFVEVYKDNVYGTFMFYPTT